MARSDQRAHCGQQDDREHIQDAQEDAARIAQALAFLRQSIYCHRKQLQCSETHRKRPDRPGETGRSTSAHRLGPPGSHYAAYPVAVPIRVVLAEDNLLIREGVRRLLEAQEDVELAVSCGDFDALLAAVEAERPDVVITDIRMPPTGTDEGIRAADRLRTSHPETGVLVLSQYDDAEYALALLERVSRPDQLVAAIREVAQGGSVIDPRVVEGLVAQRTRVAHSPIAKLTARERDVLASMAEGKTNAAIADALTLTPRAVEKHINAIFSKLPLEQPRDVDRRVTAVLLFLADQA
jgi:DNA-binding NarL/FixJ family response regulator